MTSGPDFTEEQKQYLQGFVSGVQARRQGNGRASDASVSALAGVEGVHRIAQDRFLVDGRKLSAEEEGKRKKNPFEMWDEIEARAEDGQFPKGIDVFLTKYHGLFFVAPAQNSYMCRLRIPGGILNSFQFRGIADLAERLGGGYADITTRANLQIREIGAGDAVEMITGLQDIGLTSRGSGADNIRNVTGGPTAGIDAQEIIDTRPLSRAMHHYILNHREMYGLPRKFNIAFDGGGKIAALEDTNDIGFSAVRLAEGHDLPAGVYFRMQLGGITGHKDFARDTGLMLKPEECVSVAAAVVRVFIKSGDRTDRNKARLKYVLDAWGFEKFLDESEKELGRKLTRFPLEQCNPRGPIDRLAHAGVHKQKQEGLNYIGVIAKIGRLSVAQMYGLADIADRHGSGTIRLTVWQNLLISDIPDESMPAALEALKALGLNHDVTPLRAGLIACTGNAGCKYAAANTKAHAEHLAEYLESRVRLESPVNIHLTGCHHSCAQHYIGDIGLIATKVEQGEDQVEGYNIFVGGGANTEQAIAQELWQSVPFEKIPARLERLLQGYLSARANAQESFHAFTSRLSPEALRVLAGDVEAEG